MHQLGVTGSEFSVNLSEGFFVVDRENRDVGENRKHPADRPADPKQWQSMNLRDIGPDEGDVDDSHDGDEKKGDEGWGFGMPKAPEIEGTDVHITIKDIGKANEGDSHRAHFKGHLESALEEGSGFVGEGFRRDE